MTDQAGRQTEEETNAEGRQEEILVGHASRFRKLA
jgi:hypothetical protein